MKSLLLGLGVILIGLTIFGYSEVWGANWISYGQTNLSLHYFDLESISRPSENVLIVWVKYEYTNAGIIAAVERLGDKYIDLSESRSLYEINCKQKKYRCLSSTDYSKDGTILNEFSTPMAWKYMVPKSNIESLYKLFCVRSMEKPL
jgi:hypothetical protein